MKNQKDYTILFVNPVPRTSAQGRHLQQFMILDPSNGDLRPSRKSAMNKVAEDDTTHCYEFPMNGNTHRLETGLDTLFKNPFKDMDASEISSTYSLGVEWQEPLKEVVKQNKITRQMYFEILANVAPGFYTSEIIGGTIFNEGWRNAAKKAPKNYLQKFKIHLYPRPNRFASDTPRGRLAMELIKMHPSIAPSLELANTSLHNFYISEENEAEVRINEKRDKIAEANYYYYTFKQKETPLKRYQLAILLKDAHGHTVVKGELSDDKVTHALNTYISETSPRQMDNVEYFIEKCTLLESSEGSERFEIEYLIQQAYNTNVMTNMDGYIIWHSQKDKSNVSKFTDVNKLISFLLSEYKKDDDSDTNNWYNTLLKELKLKGVRIDD